MAFGDFTVVRASEKRVLGSAGTLVTYANNVPAFEWNADGTYRGLSVEPGATNLQTYSADFRNIAEGGATNTWTPNDTLIISTNNTAPDGTSTATRIRGNGANRARQASITGTSGAPYAGSFWIRRVSGTGTVNVRVGDVGQVATVNPTITWQRFSHTASPTTTTVRIAVVFPNDTDVFEIWGAQLETGSVATSYIPTVASTANRSADSVTLTGAGSLIGATEGALYAEFETRNSSASGWLLALDADLSNNRIIFVRNSNNTISAIVTDAGVAQANIATVSNLTGVQRLAFGYKQDDFALYRLGNQVGLDASGTIPTVSRIGIGCAGDGTNAFNGWIRSVALYTTRLSNAQLQALTS